MIQATLRFDLSLLEKVNGLRESGLHYRATGRFSTGGIFVWDWIGTHAEYDRLAGRG
jgi:hypothetical protein